MLIHHGQGLSELPDFLEVGLDAETRFRRLKEHYIVLKEDQVWVVDRITMKQGDMVHFRGLHERSWHGFFLICDIELYRFIMIH